MEGLVHLPVLPLDGHGAGHDRAGICMDGAAEATTIRYDCIIE